MRAKHAFNLIEISIALGVIAVGIVAVVGAFPLAANKTRDAMAETYAAQAAADMLALIEYQGRQNWPVYFEGSTVLPAAKPSGGTARGGVIADTNGTIYGTATPGAYHIIRYTDANGNGTFDIGEIVDFEAEMLVWRSLVSEDWKTSNFPYSEAVRLNVEISWPVAVPYANRQKAYYTTELSRR
ncbi:MAG: prepilin-type N-terminal cleavage/methylation domain-containing protein [Lentisphaeria bacterium]|nr:prepilin-type N-terminal cleavage/methylation domain-containing protein [Lentisphaeria bacterium]